MPWWGWLLLALSLALYLAPGVRYAVTLANFKCRCIPDEHERHSPLLMQWLGYLLISVLWPLIAWSDWNRSRKSKISK